MIAIVDTSALYAAVVARERDHDRCAEVFERADLDFVVPALVAAEMSHLLGSREGASAESAFVRGLATLEVEAPTPDEWPAIADLVERYADFPLGAVDASVAVLADRYRTDLIITLDRRHFSVIRSARGAFQLLP